MFEPRQERAARPRLPARRSAGEPTTAPHIGALPAARPPAPVGDTVLARKLARAVALRSDHAGRGPFDGPVLQRLRLTPLDATLGGTTPTTNWGRLAAKVAQYNAAVTAGRSFIVRRELLDEVEQLLRAGKALHTGSRGVRHRDARAAKRAAGQALLAQIATERIALQNERQRLVATFGSLGDESWRMYIDLRRQHFGSEVFDAGLHGKPPEPGYLASMAAAHKFARDRLGERMTVADYEQLQGLSRQHSNDAAAAGWSQHTDHVDADRSTAGAAFEQQILHDAWQGATAQDAYAYAQARGIPMGDTFKLQPTAHTVNFSFHYAGKSEAASKARIQALFDGFYAALRVTADPLREISALHKNLEYMHPFVDANTRTNLVVLNKLLVECGYNPVVLDDPNQSYTQTIDEWVALIQRGLRRFRAIRRAKSIGLDVEQFMTDFDTHAGTPARNKLQPRDNAARDLANVDFTT